MNVLLRNTEVDTHTNAKIAENGYLWRTEIIGEVWGRHLQYFMIPL